MADRIRFMKRSWNDRRGKWLGALSKTDRMGKEVNHSCLKGGWWANRGEAKLPVERNWSIRKDIIFQFIFSNLV